MAASPALAVLITGRLLTGLAVGLMASTATAYLGELHLRANHAAAGSAFPGLVATTANLGGLAIGPLTGGILAKWAPLPLHTSYLVFAGVMAALTAAVAFTPETVDVPAHSQRRPVRFALLPGARASFTGAAAVGFFALALLGLFSSLSAAIVRAQLHTASILVVGLVPFTAFAASAVAQIALLRLTHTRLLTTGSVLFPVGLALTTLSLYEPHLWLLLAGAGLAGGGAGLLFKGAVTETVRSAKPAARAGVLAIFFVIAYLGMGLPSIVFSLVIQHTAVKPSMIGFASNTDHRLCGRSRHSRTYSPARLVFRARSSVQICTSRLWHVSDGRGLCRNPIEPSQQVPSPRWVPRPEGRRPGHPARTMTVPDPRKSKKVISCSPEKPQTTMTRHHVQRRMARINQHLRSSLKPNNMSQPGSPVD